MTGISWPTSFKGGRGRRGGTGSSLVQQPHELSPREASAIAPRERSLRNFIDCGLFMGCLKIGPERQRSRTLRAKPLKGLLKLLHWNFDRSRSRWSLFWSASARSEREAGKCCNKAEDGSNFHYISLCWFLVGLNGPTPAKPCSSTEATMSGRAFASSFNWVGKPLSTSRSKLGVEYGSAFALQVVT